MALKDLIPNLPSAIGLQILLQATVTSFQVWLSPDQMKFLTQESKDFKRDIGQA